MTQLEVRCRCGGEIGFEPIADVPPPPMPILDVAAMRPPEEWRGWIWKCKVCGEQMGVSYDWGKLDLGIVRDSVLKDRDNKFQVFDEIRVFDA